MNHVDFIKYIKSHCKIMLEDKVKSIEHVIRSNIKKQYKLKNPILHEYCIIHGTEEFNRLLSAENKECLNEIGDIDEYILTVDNNYFNENIAISNDIKVILIRIEKIDNQLGEDDENKELLPKDTNEKIKIISIEKNSYCGYLLYEI